MATRAKALGAIGGTASNVVEPVPSSMAPPGKAPVAGGKPTGGNRDGKENAMPNGNNHNSDQQRDWDDLDAEDNGDPLMVSEYVVDIIEYMRRIEVPSNCI